MHKRNDLNTLNLNVMKTILMRILMAMLLAAPVAFAGAVGNGGEGRVLQVEVIQHKNNLVAVHYSAESDSDRVKVRIVSMSSREVVYTEVISHQKMAVKRYDLSHLPAGQYLLEVINGGETVSHYVEVK
jgi:hypothetical protein